MSLSPRIAAVRAFVISGGGPTTTTRAKVTGSTERGPQPPRRLSRCFTRGRGSRTVSPVVGHGVRSASVEARTLVEEQAPAKTTLPRVTREPRLSDKVRAIAQGTHNEVYLLLVDSIGDAPVEIRRGDQVGGSGPDAIASHREILDRIVARDRDGARRTMRAHLENVEEHWRSRAEALRAGVET